MDTKNLPLRAKIFTRQIWFYAFHPKLLKKEHRPIAVAIIAALIVLLGLFAGLWWFLTSSPDFVEPQFRLDYVGIPQVLGKEATESGELKEATESASTSVSVSTSTSEGEEGESGSVPVVGYTNRINFPVNKFGVHAFAGTDQVELASDLVNTNGGDWGWVTFTMNINHPDAGLWNGVFAKCREKHIIPIIQLSNDGAIPSDEQMQSMAEFLHSLEWPTRLRIVSVFNEVNASEYWGWKIDPESYAHVLDKIIDLLRGANPDFFILNGPFNSSARTGHVLTDLGVETSYLTEDEFLKRMNTAVPGIFAKLDGWASHCYPHPGYTARPLTTASPALRDTMSSYKWELGLLSSYFGVTNIPVFITETGWPHAEGTTYHSEWLDQNTVAEYYKIVFRDLYGPDSRVVAVAPFILKYDGYDNFAFMKPDGSHYPQWEAITSLPKTAGAPPL
jgi:hypothetical protein